MKLPRALTGAHAVRVHPRMQHSPDPDPKAPSAVAFVCTFRPSQEVVAAHSASSGASGPKLPPAAMLKLLHRNMDGDWRMGR